MPFGGVPAAGVCSGTGVPGRGSMVGGSGVTGSWAMGAGGSTTAGGVTTGTSAGAAVVVGKKHFRIVFRVSLGYIRMEWNDDGGGMTKKK